MNIQCMLEEYIHPGDYIASLNNESMVALVEHMNELGKKATKILRHWPLIKFRSLVENCTADILIMYFESNSAELIHAVTCAMYRPDLLIEVIRECQDICHRDIHSILLLVNDIDMRDNICREVHEHLGTRKSGLEYFNEANDVYSIITSQGDLEMIDNNMIRILMIDGRINDLDLLVQKVG